MAGHEPSQVHYRIGPNEIKEPLVGIPAVKAHLALLHAWPRLKDHVTNTLNSGDFSMLRSKVESLKSEWMLGLAVERFESWCKSLVKSDLQLPISSILPPLDVLMVWHAYLLNPSWLLEDSARLERIQILRELSAIVFSPDNASKLQAIIESPSIDEARLRQWESRVARPFDLVKAVKNSANLKEIRCPICGSKISIAYVNLLDTGYLQDLKITEHSCERPITLTKSFLTLRRLVDDITDVSLHLRGCLKPDMSVLSQTIKSNVMNASISKHKFLKPLVATSTPKEREEMVQAIMLDAEYDLEKLKRTIAKASGGLLDRKLPRLDRIMSAYHDEMDYSIDLADAVLHQGSFVRKMTDLNWTYPGFFDDKNDEVALHHAIARYHAFLDLMASSPGTLFVPTLDIDLIWHTHQLRSEEYQADTEKYLGRFINHDDKIEASQLSSAFQTTCRSWKDRFKVPYHLCGCSFEVVGENIGGRLKRIVTTSSVIKISNSTPALQLPMNLSPLLIPVTHPSDYNAVMACPKTATTFVKRLPVDDLKRKLELQRLREEREQCEKAQTNESRPAAT